MALTVEIGLTTYIEVIQAVPLISHFHASNVVVGSSQWQNPGNRFDVLDDGVVDLRDYDAIVSYIELHGSGKLPKVKPVNEVYVDVNGDGSVNQQDISQLLVYIQNKKVTDNTATKQYNITDFKLQRDLLDPSTVSTVKDVAADKNILPTSDYLVFLRDLSTNDLKETTFSAAVHTRDSLVFIRKDMIVPTHPFTEGCYTESCIFRLIKARIKQSEILPIRFNKTKPVPGIHKQGDGLPQPGTDTSELPLVEPIPIIVPEPITYPPPQPSPCIIIGELKLVRMIDAAWPCPCVLSISMMCDDQFTLYISTDDSVLGTLIAGPTADLNAISLFNVDLAPGVTHYIHVVGSDMAQVIAGFAGVFGVSESLKFENGANALNTTELSQWSVSRTGFGTAYETPTRSVDTNHNWSIFGKGGEFLTAYAIWTNYGHDFLCTRYFSAKVIPNRSTHGDYNPGTTTCTTAMVSNTIPAPYVASASSEYSYGSSSYQAWKAFNGTNTGESDRWISTSSNAPWYLQYDFNTDGPAINKYAIQEQNYDGISVVNNKIIQEPGYNSDIGFPTDFTFEGSNDNINWTVLDTRVNVSPPGMNNWTPYFTFNNGTNYRYYRLFFSGIKGLPPPPVPPPPEPPAPLPPPPIPGVLYINATCDDAFSIYISTDDSVAGTLIGGPFGGFKAWQTNRFLSANLTPGVTNYIHVVGADDMGTIGGFAGVFELSGSFKFENNTNKLNTAEIAYWKVSKIGFGSGYQVPTKWSTRSPWASAAFLSDYAIWTNNGYDLFCTRYFTAKIVVA